MNQQDVTKGPVSAEAITTRTASQHLIQALIHLDQVTRARHRVTIQLPNPAYRRVYAFLELGENEPDPEKPPPDSFSFRQVTIALAPPDPATS